MVRRAHDTPHARRHRQARWLRRLQPPRPRPLHLLLELDRDTEPAERLHEKATRYARAIPRSALRHANPLILLAVPTTARAQTATAAVTSTGAPITVAVWHSSDAYCPRR